MRYFCFFFFLGDQRFIDMNNKRSLCFICTHIDQIESSKEEKNSDDKDLLLWNRM